jgi:hypothetical protein
MSTDGGRDDHPLFPSELIRLDVLHSGSSALPGSRLVGVDKRERREAGEGCRGLLEPSESNPFEGEDEEEEDGFREGQPSWELVGAGAVGRSED